MVRLVLGLFLALMVNDSTGSVEGNIEVFNFKVLLDDREVGRHTFVVEDSGNQVAGNVRGQYGLYCSTG